MYKRNGKYVVAIYWRNGIQYGMPHFMVPNHGVGKTSTTVDEARVFSSLPRAREERLRVSRLMHKTFPGARNIVRVGYIGIDNKVINL